MRSLIEELVDVLEDALIEHQEQGLGFNSSCWCFRAEKVIKHYREEKDSDGINFGEFVSDLIENAPPLLDSNGEIIPIVATEIDK